jgi:protein ImuB
MASRRNIEAFVPNDRSGDMFGVLYAADAHEALIDVAREFSPRVEAMGAAEVVLDLTGLTRLFGETRTIAEELRRTAADRGLRVRVAIAATRTAARLLVRYRAGLTVVEPGMEADAVAPLPVALLAGVHASGARDRSSRPAVTRRRPLRAAGDSNEPPPSPDQRELDDLIRTLTGWGLRTLGDLAALPADEVAARLGQAGVRWQQVACGADLRPLVPSAPDERFEQALDLEWPIEGLEPLSFVLGRLLEPLAVHLERRDRGAAVLHVRLQLVTREVHERSLQLPVPMREARTLRTLLLLDLESHPPPAAIDRVVVAVDPTPARVVQFSLLTRPLPSPEQLSTLMARLHALMGETRCGSPAVVDAWAPGAFALQPFAPVDVDVMDSDRAGRGGDVVRHSSPGDGGPAPAWSARVETNPASSGPPVALRRLRVPVMARVRVEGGAPVHVMTDRAGAGGRVESCAGPWRTSGAWWTDPDEKAGAAPHLTGGNRRWDRDEWDVTLSDGVTCRIFRERGGGRWFLEGVVD